MKPSTEISFIHLPLEGNSPMTPVSVPTYAEVLALAMAAEESSLNLIKAAVRRLDAGITPSNLWANLASEIADVQRYTSAVMQATSGPGRALLSLAEVSEIVGIMDRIDAFLAVVARLAGQPAWPT